MDAEKLLQSGYQSLSMGISAIDLVESKAGDPKLKKELHRQLTQSKKQMEGFIEALNRCGERPQDISPVSKISANVMSSIKLMSNEKDETILEMMIKGTQMGIDQVTEDLAKGDKSCVDSIKLMEDLLSFYHQNMKNLKSLSRNKENENGK